MNWSCSKALQVSRHAILAATMLSLAPVAAAEPPPRFKEAKIKVEDGNYIVSATIQYTLPDIVMEALLHGVSLEIDTNLQAIEIVPWWPDRLLHESAVRRKLHYHIISKRYVVTDFNQGRQNSYYSLSQALQELGHINWQVPTVKIESAADKVQFSIQNYLDVQRLPLPLQLVARTHPDWRQLVLPVVQTLLVQR
ncbi:MAG: DUF4390 domain-containing protein [Candidatus Porifericomitaceae bacterium WSBS_2022_MAG_OTU9]